jgi:hypothetical protein
MTPSRAAAYLGGGILLAAWFTSAAGVTRQPRAFRAPQPSSQAAQLDTLAANVQSQASRLRLRLAAAPSPQSPIRNPFTFAARESAAPATVPRRPEPREAMAAAGPVESEPDLVLLGIAEQGKTRTALIGSGEELIMATEGQPVAGRYRVGAVSADGVELKDQLTGATRRLTLRSPASLP